jgi:hypothetical protein
MPYWIAMLGHRRLDCASRRYDAVGLELEDENLPSQQLRFSRLRFNKQVPE